MSVLFWAPFGVGTVYSLRKELKKPVAWGLPVSALTTTTVLHTLTFYKNIETIPVGHMKSIPKTFAAAAIVQGSIFCLGHLITKMAYPVFQDDDAPLPFDKI
jgi:hypothetical protein